MSISDLISKEYYIVDCNDFVYFARPVSIVGICGGCVEDEIEYILDIYDYVTNDNRTAYMWQLYEKEKDAKKEAKRLNNIPENKERAKDWNKTGKYLAAMFGGRI